MTITGFGSECFKKSCKGESNKALLQGYCSVLNSKQSEESQVSLSITTSMFFCLQKTKITEHRVDLRYKKSFSQIINTIPCVLQVNFARWEPRHGRFRFRHPWKHYLKIGSVTRQCAYRIDTLNGYINSEIQVYKYNRQYFLHLIPTFNSNTQHNQDIE